MYKAVPTILSSTLRFEPGTKLESSYSLFEDNEEDNEDSFYKMNEAKIVKELLSKEAERSLIFQALGFKNNDLFYIDNIDNTFPNSSCPGDFDLIICENDTFDKISVLEIKQVKVKNGNIQKISGVKEKGIKQA